MHDCNCSVWVHSFSMYDVKGIIQLAVLLVCVTSCWFFLRLIIHLHVKSWIFFKVWAICSGRHSYANQVAVLLLNVLFVLKRISVLVLWNLLAQNRTFLTSDKLPALFEWNSIHNLCTIKGFRTNFQSCLYVCISEQTLMFNWCHLLYTILKQLNQKQSMLRRNLNKYVGLQNSTVWSTQQRKTVAGSTRIKDPIFNAHQKTVILLW